MLVVTISFRGFVVDQMQYDFESDQYRWWSYNNNNNNNNKNNNNK